MKRAGLTGVFLLAAILVAVNTQMAMASAKSEDNAKNNMKGSQDAKGSKNTEEAMMAAMMEKWEKYATPNENHEVLRPLVGSWDHEVRWKMSAEGPEEVSKGTNEASWIMGNKFIQQKVSGNSMGQPFEGIAIIGYDNLKRTYTSIWLDSMATGMMKATGEYDQIAKTLTESGDYSCPMTGEGQRPFRAVTTFVDDDHYTYEMYTTDLMSGEEFRSMLVSYTRKGSTQQE